MPTPHIPPVDQVLPGMFEGSALAAAPEQWVHELDGSVRTELGRLLAALEEDGESTSLTSAVIAATADVTARAAVALSSGLGFLLVRGVPVADHSPRALASLYMTMGRAIGRPEPQTLEGDLITDIRDTGEDPRDPNVRRYRTSTEQDFHTDGADVIGLLCRAPAKSGGVSRIVSSVRVFQAVRAVRPDLAPLLFEPWHFYLPGARVRGLPEAIPRPIATFDGRKLETFFIGWYIRNAQGVPSVPPLDDARHELLALYEATANAPSFYLDMHFQPGDVQWLRNAFVLHKRTAYEDHPEPARKRHLLRLWLSATGLDDAMPRFPIGGGLPR